MHVYLISESHEAPTHLEFDLLPEETQIIGGRDLRVRREDYFESARSEAPLEVVAQDSSLGHASVVSLDIDLRSEAIEFARPIL